MLNRHLRGDPGWFHLDLLENLEDLCMLVLLRPPRCIEASPIPHVWIRALRQQQPRGVGAARERGGVEGRLPSCVPDDGVGTRFQQRRYEALAPGFPRRGEVQGRSAAATRGLPGVGVRPGPQQHERHVEAAGPTSGMQRGRLRRRQREVGAGASPAQQQQRLGRNRGRESKGLLDVTSRRCSQQQLLGHGRLSATARLAAGGIRR
mmetsp:Transcript_66423/g.185662  ORF Transcript_66423/g.185662 Transcript_66423/m.185662 type:complete len:206 (+) Transcript_66423:246-863(+)